jgi:hypothetical protein
MAVKDYFSEQRRGLRRPEVSVSSVVPGAGLSHAAAEFIQSGVNSMQDELLETAALRIGKQAERGPRKHVVMSRKQAEQGSKVAGGARGS